LPVQPRSGPKRSVRPRRSVVEGPAELAAELQRDGAAKAAWEKLSYSHRRAHVESITGAKAEATRAKRVAKVLDALRT
jgi:uncharacterized protein YdeI (YjbR/CyaY-like superfamily)